MELRIILGAGEMTANKTYTPSSETAQPSGPVGQRSWPLEKQTEMLGASLWYSGNTKLSLEVNKTTANHVITQIRTLLLKWVGKASQTKIPHAKAKKLSKPRKREPGTAGVRGGDIKVKVKMASESSKAHLLLILGEPTVLEVAIFFFFHIFRSF